MDILSNLSLDTLIQGGAIGIAILLIIALIILIKGILKIMGNHMNHSTKAVEGLTNVITKLDQTVEANTKQTERIEQVIDAKL